MNKQHTPLLASLASAALFAQAGAVTTLIDFGNASGTGYNDAPLVGGTSTGNVALIDTTTAATGWTVNVTENGNGNGGNAGAGANVSTFPASLSSFAAGALQDSIFANGTMGSMVLTFAGLDAAATYDLLLYGSRGNGQSIAQTWTLAQGTGPGPVTHPSGLNSTTAINWAGVAPNASGVIEIDITNNSGDFGALALNFGSLTENPIPEPSSVLLLSLAGLSLLGRRRR